MLYLPNTGDESAIRSMAWKWIVFVQTVLELSHDAVSWLAHGAGDLYAHVSGPNQSVGPARDGHLNRATDVLTQLLEQGGPNPQAALATTNLVLDIVLRRQSFKLESPANVVQAIFKKTDPRAAVEFVESQPQPSPGPILDVLCRGSPNALRNPMTPADGREISRFCELLHRAQVN